MTRSCAAIFCLTLLTAAAPKRSPPQLGANTFDLLLQFTGRASGVGGSAAGLRITQAMGEKRIDDAKEAGFTFLRFSAAGYAPSWPNAAGQNDLSLWLTDPIGYWAEVHRLLKTLDHAGLRAVPSFLWNAVQFPALTNETVTDLIANPASRSRTLAKRYIADFVTHTKNDPAILFYELGNELNLGADLDLTARCRRQHRQPAGPALCAATGNYTTAQLIAFDTDMAGWIRRLDPAHRVTSGDSAPRAGAAHLAAQPEFSAKGPDWTPDSRAALSAYLERVNAPFDIVSLHIYPGRDSIRPAAGMRTEMDMARLAATLFHPRGKPIFLGEFGARAPSALIADAAAALQSGTVDFAALWVWEFYQMSTHPPANAPRDAYDVEPGLPGQAFPALDPVRHRATAAVPPRVVLTWPLPCAVVTAPTDLFAIASAGAAPASRVEFRVDGRLVGAASTLPFHTMFDPRGLSPRRARIEARAVAPSGATAGFFSDVMLNGAAGDCDIAASGR